MYLKKCAFSSICIIEGGIPNLNGIGTKMAVWDGKWNFERKNEISSKNMKLLGHEIKL